MMPSVKFTMRLEIFIKSMPTKFTPKPIGFDEQQLFKPFVYNEKTYVIVEKEKSQFTMRCVLSTGRLGGKRVILETEYVAMDFMTTEQKFFVRITKYSGTNPAEHTL
jgi:hypothetical protein